MGDRDRVEHECRQEGRCKARIRDEAGIFHGAGVERPGSLCRPCESAAFEAIGHLYADWCALEDALTKPRPRADGPKIRKTSERSIPIPLYLDTLKCRIDDETFRWAIRLTKGDPVPTARDVRVQRCVTILTAGKGTLVDLPARVVDIWVPRHDGGDDLSCRLMDGVDAVLTLARLHQRSVEALGLTEVRLWLKDPCPHCGRKALLSSKDQARVTCRGCGVSWDKDHFALLSNVLDFERRQVAA